MDKDEGSESGHLHQRGEIHREAVSFNDALIESYGVDLFNHLGRLQKDLGRNRDAELLGRLQVKNQIELSRLRYG